jgi:DnaD/phage-associated family protein
MSFNAKTILSDRPIAYHPIIAKSVGSVVAALFLSQLMYWSDKGKDKEGWIWKTRAEMEEETGLSRSEQDTARKVLGEHGVLEEKRAGTPAKMHYRIKWDELCKLVGDFEQSSLQDSAIKIAGNKQTITEITTESTTESTSTATKSKIFSKYENEISLLTPLTVDFLTDWERDFPEDWVLDAIAEAVAQNVRRPKYIDAILKRWKVEGRGKKSKSNGREDISETRKRWGIDGNRDSSEENISEDVIVSTAIIGSGEGRTIENVARCPG